MIHVIDETCEDRITLSSRSSLKKSPRGVQILPNESSSKGKNATKLVTIPEKSVVVTMKESRSASVPTKRSQKLDTETSDYTGGKLPYIYSKIRKSEQTERSVTSRQLNESRGTINDIKGVGEALGALKKLDINEKKSQRVLMEDVYEGLSSHRAKDEEREQVKALDRWKLEIKRNNIRTTMDKTSGITEMYKKKKPKENSNLPLLNTEALNRILNESEDQGEGSDSGRSTSGPVNLKAKGPNTKEEKKKGAAEVPMVDDNANLINDLIMRKVNNQFPVDDIKKLPMRQLRAEIKLIVESVVFKFKILKKHGSEAMIMHHVENILKKLRSQAKAQDENLGMNENLVESTKNELTEEEEFVDYRMIELALIKNYEHAVEEIKGLGSRIIHLNSENFKLKKVLLQYQEQLLQLDRKFRAMAEESQMMEMKQGSGDESVMSGDFIKAHKARQEKKKQEALIKEKIAEVKQKIGPIVRETENAEAELKAARDSKAYFKMQLKDLYFQLLKDEKYLLRCKSEASYTWVIRALWNINEEVKEQAFPSFMDKNCVKFILEYAKAQAELEKYCKEYGLMGIITSLDDFKRTNLIGQNQQETKAKEVKDGKETKEVKMRIDETNNEVSPKIEVAKPKAKGELLEQKMTLIKKANLKAKRLVNVVQYNTRGRFVIPKWEEVNLSTINDLNSDRSKQKQTEGDTPTLVANQDKVKQAKVETALPVGVLNPSENVAKLLNNLNAIKKSEINRIIKENLSSALNDRLQSTIEKSLLFMFGYSEGSEAFRRFMKEKRIFEERNMKAHKKQSHTHSRSPKTNPAVLPISFEKSDDEPKLEIFRKINTIRKLSGLKKKNSEAPSMKLRDSNSVNQKLNLSQQFITNLSQITSKKASIVNS